MGLPRVRPALAALFAAILGQGVLAAAQQAGPPPPVAKDETTEWFDRGAIPELRITLTAQTRNSLRREPKTWVTAKLVETGSTFAFDVGLKLKGSAGSFRDLADRPGFTIDVNRVAADRQLHGLVKFHLNNAVQDPTFLQELIGYELFRRAGLPAPRITHARVFLDGRDLGLYVFKEGYDRRFLARWFGRKDGNLYDGAANGDVGDELERDSGDLPLDRRDLRALAAACAEADPERRQKALDASVDVDRFLTFMAMEALVGHWDGYTPNKNNWRVYFDPGNGKAVFIPHGMDQIFGRDQPVFWRRPQGRVAIAVLAEPSWRERCARRCQEVRALLAPEAGLAELVRTAAARILPVMRKIGGERRERALATAIDDLQQRIRDRAAQLAAAAVAMPEGPLPVPAEGAPLAALAWRQQLACEDVRLEDRGKDGERRLLLRAGSCGHCTGSWRTTVTLSRGRYRLCGTVSTQQVRALGGDNGGAVIRISGATRKDGVTGTVNDKAVEWAFEIGDEEREVVLVLELRAVSGEAAFAASSLRLFRR